jgi:shikimate dehydrogenase
MNTNQNRLAVLGSPIAHSKSPALHAAAYAALGLDWEYGTEEVPEGALAAFVDSRGSEWRGLSLTMPLKRAVLPLLDSQDALVELTGSANTVLFEGGLRLGFNTDVYGIQRAFTEVGIDRLDTVQVLGAGATASSVLVAVSRLGAKRVTISARTPAKAVDLQALGEVLGVEVVVRRWGTSDRSMIVPDAVVSTLPGGSAIDIAFAEPVREGAVLFDVSYEPWPSPLASAWNEVGGRVISGLDMLVLQALVQVRIFVAGDPDISLPNEDTVLQAMRASVGGTASPAPDAPPA